MKATLTISLIRASAYSPPLWLRLMEMVGRLNSRTPENIKTFKYKQIVEQKNEDSKYKMQV